MRRHESDPLSFIPHPEVVREHLQAVEEKADRLRTLLRVSEEIHNSKSLSPQNGRDQQGGGHGR